MVDDLGEAADGIDGLALELADVAERPGDDRAGDRQEEGPDGLGLNVIAGGSGFKQ